MLNLNWVDDCPRFWYWRLLQSSCIKMLEMGHRAYIYHRADNGTGRACPEKGATAGPGQHEPNVSLEKLIKEVPSSFQIPGACWWPRGCFALGMGGSTAHYTFYVGPSNQWCATTVWEDLKNFEELLLDPFRKDEIWRGCFFLGDKILKPTMHRDSERSGGSIKSDFCHHHASSPEGD